MKDDKRCRVARRKGRHRLQHTILRTRRLGRIPSQEMITSLFRRQLRNGRKDTIGIASEHDDVLRLTLDMARDTRVGNKFDRISTTRVLRDRHVVIVWVPVCRIEHDVFENRSKPNRVVDFGLLLRGEVNRLGIASSFNVEHASVGPDVLVVSNQLTRWVSREGRLARSGKTKEERDVSLFDTNVCRRMKRELTKLDGLEIMHDGEDTFLHLTCIFRTENDHFHTLEIDFDGRGRGHSGREAVCGELTGVVDDEIGLSEVL